jgi:hypothetical protein
MPWVLALKSTNICYIVIDFFFKINKGIKNKVGLGMHT